MGCFKLFLMSGLGWMHGFLQVAIDEQARDGNE